MSGRGRRGLLLLASLFFVPLFAALLLYFSLGWRPGGGTQHGELIDPARPLPAVTLPQAGGAPAGDPFRGKWTLVYLGDGACDARCEQALADMRQVRLALGEDAMRVQRVFLYRGACCAAGWLESRHPGLVAADAGGPAAAPLLALFPATPGEPGRIYLVDPLGNLLMSYPADAPAKGLLEDLERLLRLSRIG